MPRVAVKAFDHVGIRVSDRSRSLAFYAQLGFVEDPATSSERVAEVVNSAGIRLNLIFNGVAQPGRRNILLDDRVKFPGYTHAAFIVGRLQQVIDWADEAGVAITEGPVDWGRRVTCFIRDPDGNVLEFNELK